MAMAIWGDGRTVREGLLHVTLMAILLDSCLRRNKCTLVEGRGRALNLRVSRRP